MLADRFASRPRRRMARPPSSGRRTVLADPHDGRGLRLAGGRSARRRDRRPGRGGSLRLVANPLRFDGERLPTRLPPPVARRRLRGGARSRDATRPRPMHLGSPQRGRATWSRGRSQPTILDVAPESPFGFPAELFIRRADRAAGDGAPPTPTTVAAARSARRRRHRARRRGRAAGRPACRSRRAAPGSSRSTVRPRCSRRSKRRASGARTARDDRSLGRWPDVAPQTPAADVAVCGHVAYNAPDLDAFVVALTAHARRRVVLELTDRHPLSWMNDLWLRPARRAAARAPRRRRRRGPVPCPRLRRASRRAGRHRRHGGKRVRTPRGRRRRSCDVGSASRPSATTRSPGRSARRLRRARRSVERRTERAARGHAVVGREPESRRRRP